MARKPDLPCADCGEMLWRGTNSLPEGEARCRPCRARAHGLVEKASLLVVARQQARQEPKDGNPARTLMRHAAWRCRRCGRDERVMPRSPYCAACSPPRGSKKNTHRRRARRFGVAYEPVDPQAVFDRDGWTCHLCGDAIDIAARWPDRMCASLDHVVPMSLGGPHLYENVRASHWLCNVLKGEDPEMHFRLEVA